MTDIDLSKIKPGDRVRVRYYDMKGWQTVGEVIRGRPVIQPMGIWLPSDDIEILEHKPAPTKIEVALPKPRDRKWSCTAMPEDSLSILGRGQEGVRITARNGSFAGIIYLTKEHAEELALALLAFTRADA